MPGDGSGTADTHGETLAALVDRAEAGDRTARDVLFAALYDDLHRLAEMHVRRARGVVTLGATTLLHEAYLGIASRDALAFPDRSRFLAYSSRAIAWKAPTISAAAVRARHRRSARPFQTRTAPSALV